jgi:hypothetical protein
MSRFGDVEAQCLAKMQTIADFADARIVPAGLIAMTRPDAFPAVFVAINKKTRLDIEGQPELQISGRVVRRCSIEVLVVIFANSDGVQLGDARLSAWSLADKVEDAFAGFVPLVGGGPTNGGPTVWPTTVGDAENVMTDNGQAGVLIPVTVQMQYGIG